MIHNLIKALQFKFTIKMYAPANGFFLALQNVPQIVIPHKIIPVYFLIIILKKLQYSMYENILYLWTVMNMTWLSKESFLIKFVSLAQVLQWNTYHSFVQDFFLSLMPVMPVAAFILTFEISSTLGKHICGTSCEIFIITSKPTNS